MTSKYDDLDCLVTLYERMRSDLEALVGFSRSDTLRGEHDFLSDRIGELEALRDGEPLDEVLAEQARDEARDRQWFQRGVV